MLFTSINKKYEECVLKSQKPTRAEILTKMRMKAVHFRNLSALSNDEKEMLLKKVNYKNQLQHTLWLSPRVTFIAVLIKVEKTNLTVLAEGNGRSSLFLRGQFNLDGATH